VIGSDLIPEHLWKRFPPPELGNLLASVRRPLNLSKTTSGAIDVLRVMCHQMPKACSLSLASHHKMLGLRGLGGVGDINNSVCIRGHNRDDGNINNWIIVTTSKIAISARRNALR